MAKNENDNAKVHKSSSEWLVWLFPLMAVAMTAWLIFHFYGQQGSMITVEFDDGSNLKAEKTELRYRGVEVGRVKDVEVSDSGDKVVAHIRLTKESEYVARSGSKFWVVIPKIALEGISGLETILSGSYIVVQPGDRYGEAENHFKGKIGGESSDPLEDTLSYMIETNNAEAVSEGDPVTYRGLKIGSVTKVNLSKTGQLVSIQLNIQNKFSRVIRTNTVFWKKVGVSAKLGLFNSEIKVNSFDTLLKGGVELSTPNDAGPRAKSGSHFQLNLEPPQGIESWNPVLN